MKYWDIITPDQQRERQELKRRNLNQRIQDATNSLACELIRVKAEKRVESTIYNVIGIVNAMLGLADPHVRFEYDDETHSVVIIRHGCIIGAVEL